MWLNIEAIRTAMTKAKREDGSKDIITKRREREKEIKESGIAICLHCNNEIRYNQNINIGGWNWESEDLLGWCDKASSNYHHPKIDLEEDSEKENGA